jgi:transcriptional regulator with XRE-family HTH domain
MESGRNRLRDWIWRSRVNQTKAAEILGVNQVVLSQWLNGVRIPGLENAVKIERITGISVESWLLTDVSKADEPVGASASKSKK